MEEDVDPRLWIDVEIGMTPGNTICFSCSEDIGLSYCISIENGRRLGVCNKCAVEYLKYSRIKW